MKEKFEKTHWHKQRQRYIKKWALGKIIELGCGNIPCFEHSVKTDIRKFKGYILFDLNFSFPLKEKFDTVIATEVIEHLWNVDNFLNECYSILNKNGIFILSTPNIKYWKNRIDLLFGKTTIFDEDEYKKSSGFVGHLRFYTPQKFCGLLKKYSFRVEEVKPIGRIRFINFCPDFIVKARK